MTMVVAESRKARCVELAKMGVPFAQIADEVGFKNKSSAWRAVSRALGERVDLAVEEYRQTELDRLDALQSALWDKAMEGDISAANTILKVIDKRIRLLGLDQMSLQSDAPRTVVVDPADLVRWGMEATR